MQLNTVYLNTLAVAAHAALMTSLLVGSSACSYRHEKNQAALTQQPGTGVSALSFEEVKTRVLEPARCTACHSKFKNHSAVFAARDKIWDEVFVKHTMPKNGTLSVEQEQILRDWLKAGAQEPAVGPKPAVDPVPMPSKPEPTATPEPTPSTPTDPRLPSVEPLSWKSVREGFFDKHCTACHGGPQPMMGLDLGNYATVKRRMTEILGRVIVEQDMPPSSDDFALITPLQKQMLLDWVQARMPETPGVPPTDSNAVAGRGSR